jgi:hypothetical protein
VGETVHPVTKPALDKEPVMTVVLVLVMSEENLTSAQVPVEPMTLVVKLGLKKVATMATILVRTKLELESMTMKMILAMTSETIPQVMMAQTMMFHLQMKL